MPLTSSYTDKSLVYGPTDSSLWSITLGALAEVQARVYGDRTAVVFPEQKIRRSYRDLFLRSTMISRALIESGLGPEDCIGIYAGNCCEYLEVFLGAASIGCPVVVLNSNYTPAELQNAVTFSGKPECKLLCLARYPGPKRDSTSHLDCLTQSHTAIQIVLFDDVEYMQRRHPMVITFSEFTNRGELSSLSGDELCQRKALVRPSDVLNLQFTSGTTGAPKAAMLSHINMINNGRYVCDRLSVTEADIVCCPAPLFHCFGLSMGFLGAFTHGATIVFPSQQFDASSVLSAIEAEKCTVLYGVPTMFQAELDVLARIPQKLTSLRTALAAGSPVLPSVIKRLGAEMGIELVLNAYGMTETSPVTFGTCKTDSSQRRLDSVGTVFPHTGAKIVDMDGSIVSRGTAGEICTSGYSLQKGYLKNVAKTAEVMRTDENGVLWMHTGDEGVIDKDGYCRVTGRIKDMIIRGGENIIPTEIEDRLESHSSITEAVVVGAPHPRYGEQVVAFARQKESTPRPSLDEIAVWVREMLGRHKTPAAVFWIGDVGIREDFPRTASGKHQKHVLRKDAVALLGPALSLAKL
ncbi:putative NRPS-like protein biosynthetic cluster [Elasticomyces elasticus]|nr:putative NRPS-like protein biosynthetic cluster [Elasticomyces elasticus]